MKKILCFAILVFGLFVSISEPYAYTLSDGIYNRNSWNGGVFWVDNSFLTFCLETNEYFSFGTAYNGTIDSGAIKGGIDGTGFDLIEDATAYLYIKYLDGGYYNMADKAKADNWAIAFQYAIWAMEGEYGYTAIPDLAKGLYDEATTGAGKDFLNNGQVMVLNLYTGTGTDVTQNQSQLIRVPEPNTILLLGAGLLTLGMVLRFRKKVV